MITSRAGLPFFAYVAIFLAAVNIPGQAIAVEEPPLAVQEEIREAFESFKVWQAAIHAEDYDQLWLLNDPRIRQ